MKGRIILGKGNFLWGKAGIYQADYCIVLVKKFQTNWLRLYSWEKLKQQSD